jgi:hypothetical protein
MKPIMMRNHPALLSFMTSKKPTRNDTPAANHDQTLLFLFSGYSFH